MKTIYHRVVRAILSNHGFTLISALMVGYACETKQEMNHSSKFGGGSSSDAVLKSLDSVADVVNLKTLPVCGACPGVGREADVRPEFEVAIRKRCTGVSACVELLKEYEIMGPDARERVKERIAGKLASLGKATVTEIASLLDGQSYYVRLAALRALALMGSEAGPATSKLADAAGRDLPQAASLLIGLGDVRGIPIRVRWLAENRMFISSDDEAALRRMGADAAQELAAEVVAAGAEDPAVADAAVDILGRLGVEAAAALPVLAEALRGSEKPDGGSAAVARAIGAIGLREESLLSLLREKRKTRGEEYPDDFEIALARLGDDEAAARAVKGLIATIQDNRASAERKQRAFSELVQMGPGVRLALDTLVRIAEREGGYRAELAILALGYSASREVVPILVGFAQSRSVIVSRAAVDALGKLGSMATDALPVLVRLSERHWSAVVRGLASDAVRRIRSSQQPMTWFRRGSQSLARSAAQADLVEDHGAKHCYRSSSELPVFEKNSVWWKVDDVRYRQKARESIDDVSAGAGLWGGGHVARKLGESWIVGECGPGERGLFGRAPGAAKVKLEDGCFEELMKIGNSVLAYNCRTELGIGECRVYRVFEGVKGGLQVELLSGLPCTSRYHVGIGDISVVELTNCGVFEVGLDGTTEQLQCLPSCRCGS